MYILELRERGYCVVNTDSIAFGTSGSHILLAQISPRSRAEMLRARKREGRRKEIKQDKLPIMIAFIIHLIMTSVTSLVLSQASHIPHFI